MYNQDMTVFHKDTRQNSNNSVPVEIVEEGQEVERQFAPALFLTEGQNVGIHDGCRVVESWTAHHRPAHIPAAWWRSGVLGQTIRQVLEHICCINGELNTVMQQFVQARYQPPNMISQQWQVETEGEPLCRTEEHHTEEEMDEILREHQLKRAKFGENVTIHKSQSHAPCSHRPGCWFECQEYIELSTHNA